MVVHEGHIHDTLVEMLIISKLSVILNVEIINIKYVTNTYKLSKININFKKTWQHLTNLKKQLESNK